MSKHFIPINEQLVVAKEMFGVEMDLNTVGADFVLIPNPVFWEKTIGYRKALNLMSEYFLKKNGLIGFEERSCDKCGACLMAYPCITEEMINSADGYCISLSAGDFFPEDYFSKLPVKRNRVLDEFYQRNKEKPFLGLRINIRKLRPYFDLRTETQLKMFPLGVLETGFLFQCLREKEEREIMSLDTVSYFYKDALREMLVVFHEDGISPEASGNYLLANAGEEFFAVKI